MDSSSTLPTLAGAMPQYQMQFGVPGDLWGFVLFLLCLAAGIGLVYLFCQQKFAERSSTGSSDYAEQFLPIQLATRQEYTKGFLTYFGLMAGVVALLAMIGPQNLGALGVPLAKDVNPSIAPMVIAFVLVGLLGNVPVLLEIEKWLRRYAHERAYIPSSARATAQRLSAADFDFAAYGGDALDQPEMRGVEAADFTCSRRTLEHDWARLACLVYEEKYRRSGGLMDGLDADLLRDYAKDLDAIENAKKSMEADVALYRERKREDRSYTDEPLRRTIRDNLYKLYVLLGCAVRLKNQTNGEIERALRQFGFKLSNVTSAPDNRDIKLVGLAIVMVSVLLLELAATELAHLRVWTATPVFPIKFFQPFIDTASTLIPFLMAIIVADFLRCRGIKKGTWYRGQSSGNLGANYIRVAVVCGLAGYVGLILWGFAQVPVITADGLLIDAPYALLAMATGGFYVYHLDNAETGRRPRPLWEILPQGAITGFCGLIAATVSFELILGDAAMAIDRIILTAAADTLVGLVLGWYLPKAAAAKSDPLKDSRAERLSALQAKALARFENSAAAADWLDKPHPALGYKSPKAAAADLDGFEHAVSLLQGPQGLAA